MITIYTDGGCSKNGQKGAIGAVGIVAIKHNKIIFEHSQTYINTTNNRMEYRAIIIAMKLCIKNNIKEVEFITDSNLLVQTINDWMYSWKKNGWKKKNHPKKIKNLDLVLELWELKQHLPYSTFSWVKGHNGNEYNEKADELATNFQLESAQNDVVDVEILKKYSALQNIG